MSQNTFNPISDEKVAECKICLNSSENTFFSVPEMMFGRGTEYNYLECSNCGCLQITNPPEDLSEYYPSGNYYSFSTGNRLNKFLTTRRANFAYHGRDLLGRILSLRLGQHNSIWLKNIGTQPSDAILDVGCGQANLLRDLRELGFDNLTGIDPHITHSEEVDHSFRVLKQSLDEVHDTYDLIMFHHSFEHVPNPKAVLRKVYDILKPDSYVIIRVPIADSFAWQHYGTHWVQIDAPRHFFLHTRKSIETLAKQTKFNVEEVICDSTAFQFVGSELYKKNLSLRDETGARKRSNYFTRMQINQFRKQASVLNAEHKGDQACFYLYKSA